MKTKTSKKIILFALVSLISTSLVFLPFKDAGANRSEELQQEIKQLEAQNSQSGNKVDALQSGAKNLQGAINNLQASIAGLHSEISANKAKSAQLKQDIKEAEIELERQKGVLGENIRAMYLEDDISTLEMLATSKDLGQFMDKQQYRNVVGDKIRGQLDLIEKLKQKLSDQRTEVELLIKKDEAMRQEIAAQKVEQNRLLALNQAQQAEFNQNIALNNKKIADFKEEQAKIAAAIARRSYAVAPVGYVSGGDVIGAVGSSGLSTAAHLHLEVRDGSGVTNPAPYIKHDPVPGSYVTQGWWAPWYLYASGHHPGIDYSRGNGAVHAIDSGNLYRGCSNQLLDTRNNEYGYVAVIEHPNGIKSVYAHMSGGPAACSYNTWR